MSEDAQRLVFRAIESVLEQAPAPIVAGDEAPPELPSLQPWAETAAPAGRNKRPLADFLAELRQRVAQDPNPAPAHITDKPPAVAFYERFSSVPPARGRRRRRRGGQPARTQGAAPAAVNEPSGTETRAQPRARRRRRGPRRGGQGQNRPPAG